MINSINIKNFKCFKDSNMTFKNANLLLGTNSGGKSSLIQALLLSKMSLDNFGKHDARSFDLTDNKYGLNLYSFDEIIYQDAEEDFISITLKYDEYESTVEYKPTDDNNVVNLKFSGDKNRSTNSVIYLSAERSISKYQKLGDIHNLKLGNDNEYLGYIIEKGRHANLIPIDKQRNHWAYKDTNVLDIQINNWLDYILPNNMVTAINTGSDNQISLLFGDKNALHSTNIGYGIAFVLPIIIAGLIANQNSVLIIENPEIHLHPKAQSNMAAFLSIISASGVQVIIETHSDHIVNGFRKAILNMNIPLEASNLMINYFNFNGVCNVENVLLNDMAEITHWPDGFLDQEENDLFEMRKLRLQK
jgi:predicted ATPase